MDPETPLFKQGGRFIGWRHPLSFPLATSGNSLFDVFKARFGFFYGVILVGVCEMLWTFCDVWFMLKSFDIAKTTGSNTIKKDP